MPAIKNSLAIVSFSAGSMGMVLIMYYIMVDMKRISLGSSYVADLRYLAFFGFVLSLMGLITGYLGKKSNFKKVAIIGFYLSIWGLMLHLSLFLFNHGFIVKLL